MPGHDRLRRERLRREAERSRWAHMLFMSAYLLVAALLLLSGLPK